MRYLIFCFMAVSLAAPAQTPEPNLRTTVSEVLLDVVVRDKKAHIIRDLRPEEIQVLENGIPQTIRLFEFLDGHSTRRPRWQRHLQSQTRLLPAHRSWRMT